MIDPLVGLDDYGRRHLTSHLIAAGRADDLHRLLDLEVVDEQGVTAHAWYRLKHESDDAADFNADVAAAWRLADATLVTEPPPNRARAVVLTCRYALITASLNSATDNLPPNILAELLRRGMRTPRSVLSMVQAIPDPSRRAVALSRLASTLVASGLEAEVIEAAAGISDEESRANGLAGVAATVVTPPGFRALMSAVRGLVTDSNKAQVLAAVASCSESPEAIHAAILEEVIHLADADAAAHVLTRLGARLSTSLAVRADAYVRRMCSPVAIARIAAIIAPRLQIGGQELIEAALKKARATRGGLNRVQALGALGQYSEALAEAKRIPSARARIEGLAALAATLAPDDLKVALEGVFTAGPAQWKAAALARLAPHVAIGDWEWVYQEVVDIEVREARVRALAAIAPHTPQALLPRLVRTTLELPPKLDPAAVLRLVADRLEVSELDAVLVKAQQLRGHGYRGALLSGVGAHLSEQQAESALVFVRRIASTTDRALAIDALAQRLSDRSLELAATSLDINDQPQAREALATLSAPAHDLRGSASKTAADNYGEFHPAVCSESKSPTSGVSTEESSSPVHQAPVFSKAAEPNRADPDVAVPHRTTALTITGATTELIITDASAQASTSGAQITPAENPPPSSDLLYWLRAAETLLPGSAAVRVALHAPDYYSQSERDESLAAALRELIDLFMESERFDDTVSVASVIPEQLGRAETLNELIGLLPDEARSDAISMAMDSAKAVFDSGDIRLRRVGKSPFIELVGVTDLAVQQDLLSAGQCEELAEMLMYTQWTLPSYPRVSDWLPASLCWALAELTSRLDQRATAESWLVQSASTIRDETLRAGTLARIGQFVGPDRLDEWSRAADLIRQPGSRADLLLVRADRFAQAGRTDEALNSLEQACSVAPSVNDPRERGPVLATIAAMAREWGEPAQKVVWGAQLGNGAGLLHQLADLGRRNLLSDMAQLAPALAAVGDEAAVETCDAICNVRRWWP